jgi:hypothetical protein
VGADEGPDVRAGAQRDGQPGLPRLRRGLRDLARDRSAELTPALLAELDELVDALDTTAATAGLELP